jgi:hypothetical protein
VNPDEMEKKKYRFSASNERAVIMECPTSDSHLKKIQAELIDVSYQAAVMQTYTCQLT